MQVPIPEVSHQLSIRFGDDSFSCDVNAYAIPVFNYYAIILVFDMEQKFFDEFDLEDVFLNQYYPVENIESALSNMKGDTKYELEGEQRRRVRRLLTANEKDFFRMQRVFAEQSTLEANPSQTRRLSEKSDKNPEQSKLEANPISTDNSGHP